MMTVVRYDPSLSCRWDEFVRNSSNGTFLHLRPYMDYHSDRFDDCSLLVFDRKKRLVALLPANISGTTLWSHQGLTYGGWVVARRHSDSQTMLDVWDAAIGWMRSHGITELIYKAIPHIYQRYPADDDLYALFRLGAEVASCQVSSAVPLDRDWLPNQGARQRMRAAWLDGVSVSQTEDFSLFMEMLSLRLYERYGAVPVHSLHEISLLAGRFPENIKLFMAYGRCGTPLAGTVLFLTDTVVHTQYIATNSEARDSGVFPAIIDYVIENECRGRRWLDFGTSCEDSGRQLNVGLNAQKYGLGGRPVAYTAYHLGI